MTPDGGPPLDGLEITAVRLERLEIRTRGTAHTLSAWALRVETPRGSGSIVRAEPTPEDKFWRGEGVFLGWAPDRLAAAWDALRAVEAGTPEPAPDFPQLG